MFGQTGNTGNTTTTVVTAGNGFAQPQTAMKTQPAQSTVQTGFSFNFDQTAAVANAAGLGSQGVGTGIFKVKINAVTFETDKSGNPRASISFDATTQYKEDGTEEVIEKGGVIYNICIAPTWSTGSENFDFAKWMEFCAVVGIRQGTIGVQKVGKTTTVDKQCFVEATGKECWLAINEEFDIYKEQEKRKLQLVKTFVPTKQSFAEASNNTEPKEITLVIKNIQPFYTKAHQEWTKNGAPVDGNSATDAAIAATTTMPWTNK